MYYRRAWQLPTAERCWLNPSGHMRFQVVVKPINRFKTNSVAVTELGLAFGYLSASMPCCTSCSISVLEQYQGWMRDHQGTQGAAGMGSYHGFGGKY